MVEWLYFLFFLAFVVAWAIVQIILELIKAKIQRANFSKMVDKGRAALVGAVGDLIGKKGEKKNV